MRALTAAALGATAILVAAPAEALPGSRLIGHRCHTYDARVTNENTIQALRHVSSVDGAWCETDVWRIADGTMIVWHDPTWARVADHSTLPPGVEPTDRVAAATSRQVRQIRTKGGQPVPTLRQFITASARHQVGLMVEVKNSVQNPRHFVGYARSVGAHVRYYRGLSRTCQTPSLPELRQAGAPIGLKLFPRSTCRLSPAQIAARGASFVTQRYDVVTSSYADAMRQRGIAIYARETDRNTARQVLRAGATKITTSDPRTAVRWPS